jgi:thioredoxin 1
MENDKHYQTVTNKEFYESVMDSNQPVMLYFAADWSGPCHIIDPTINELAAVYQNRLKFYRLDADQNIIASRIYGIRDLPTLLFLKNGRVVDHVIGAVAKKDLVHRLEAMLEPISWAEVSSG